MGCKKHCYGLQAMVCKKGMGCKKHCCKRLLKVCVVVVCTTGFLTQVIQFLYLYWTYPTVVDIQVSIPSEIDLPGISLCNSNGINPDVICSLRGYCSSELAEVLTVCRLASIPCDEGIPNPKDFTFVSYHKLMFEKHLNVSILKLLRKPLSEFLKCKIVTDGESRDCNVKDAIYGSYYSESFMPSFCFTINTLWSQPRKKIEKIKKSEKIYMEIYMSMVGDIMDPPMDLIQVPTHNYPTNPSMQMVIHSPYVSLSPFTAGQTFWGGKRYEIKLKQQNKHLLTAPYHTNCTDYLPTWLARGGVGPLNQNMVLQECKLNASLKNQGCVPITVDYPHSEDLCKLCYDCKDTLRIWDHCTDLMDSFNQPCEFHSYDMEVKEKVVYVDHIVLESHYRYLKMGEKSVKQQMGYNCSGSKMLTRRCQTVNIELVFDNFEITNLTYKPKYEALEVLSVIGGYMGMYLGISIVAMYDLAQMVLTKLLSKTKQKTCKRVVKRRSGGPLQNSFDVLGRSKVRSFRVRY